MTFAEQTHERLIFCADDACLLELFGGHSRSVSYGFNPAADYRAEVRDQAGLLWSVLVKRWGIFAELVGREKYFQRGGGRGVLHANGFETDVIREA